MYMNPDKIKSEFLRIKELGFIENVKSDSNDGGAGNTFETHLGVKENNLKDPDFEGFEVKTKKQLSHSFVSLFTQKPCHPQDGDNYMRIKYGVPDKNYPQVKCFRTSLYAHRNSKVYNKYLMSIKLDRAQGKLFLICSDLDGNVIDDTVYWTFDNLKHYSKKLANMFVVNASVSNIRGKEHYHYTGATVYMNYKGFDNFLDLIEEGLIRYDNRLGVYGPDTGKSGQPHNHGGGLRIGHKNIHKLFDIQLEVE